MRDNDFLDIPLLMDGVAAYVGVFTRGAEESAPAFRNIEIINAC